VEAVEKVEVEGMQTDFRLVLEVKLTGLTSIEHGGLWKEKSQEASQVFGMNSFSEGKTGERVALGSWLWVRYLLMLHLTEG
jgi:hypothetical protein